MSSRDIKNCTRCSCTAHQQRATPMATTTQVRQTILVMAPVSRVSLARFSRLALRSGSTLTNSATPAPCNRDRARCGNDDRGRALSSSIHRVPWLDFREKVRSGGTRSIRLIFRTPRTPDAFRESVCARSAISANAEPLQIPPAIRRPTDNLA